MNAYYASRSILDTACEAIGENNQNGFYLGVRK